MKFDVADARKFVVGDAIELSQDWTLSWWRLKLGRVFGVLHLHSLRRWIKKIPTGTVHKIGEEDVG